MSTFWKLRIATFLWGFAVIYAFTGELNLTSQVFLVQALGNSLIMWVLVGQQQGRHAER